MTTNDNLYHKQVLNESILDSAQQFYNSSIILWQKAEDHGVMIPAIICTCLSIELMLKSLSPRDKLIDKKVITSGGFKIISGDIQSESTVRGHEFSTLIDKMPPEAKHELNKKLIEREDITIDEFKSAISKFDATFVSYRYIYERRAKKINIEELIKYQKILMDAIEEIKQEYLNQQN